VEVKGRKDGRDKTVRFEMLDRYDADNHITAMMRTTGFSLALTAVMQVERSVRESGVHTPDEVVRPDEYIRGMAERGVEIRRVE
jgi:lysine 6-dehydrogenase